MFIALPFLIEHSCALASVVATEARTLALQSKFISMKLN